MKFRLYVREDNTLLEGVTQFQFLGRLLEEMTSDWLEAHQNISKAQVVWRKLGKLLQQEGADSQV